MGWPRWRSPCGAGQAEEHLPGRVARLESPRHWAQRVLVLLAATCAAAGRLAKARLTDPACTGRRSWTAATVGLMAVIVVLPVPFGNVLPALALMASLLTLGSNVWMLGRVAKQAVQSGGSFEMPLAWIVMAALAQTRRWAAVNLGLGLLVLLVTLLRWTA
ncbi:exopolysaccharide biosynthesis protein [Methylibium sp.]|uniref:exopolysaccharide biosynthesis protein n=1 Tax=Methylibium sp. TaxID=2067992 RepID=UPI0025E1F29D|nr:exopolysaccharide biosynthesis protein [Methylibium sp.]